jgi:alginate O-acetyltransferase complex protein AlgJ
MKNWQAAFLPILFVVFITIPAVVMISGNQEGISYEENRRLAEPPKLQPSLHSIQTFPAQFEAYFNDHFGLRSSLVKLYSNILVNFFRQSPKWLVVIGKKGWLFFAGDNELAAFMGYHPNPPETYHRWKQVLEDRQNWLAAQGIQYLFVVPPNKSMVYQEFLPDRIQEKEQTSTLEKFNTILASAPEFKGTVDLRAVLLAAKEKELVYHKSDTHWNLAGGYAAYSAIITHLGKKFDGLQPVPRDMLVERADTLNGGDLAAVLNLRDQYVEPNPTITLPPSLALPEWRKAAFETMPDTDNQQFRTGKLLINGTEGKELSAIFICDSFGSAMMDFLALHFKKITWITDARFEDVTHMIRQEKPDVVIDLIVARRMQVALAESREVSGPMIEKQIGELRATLDVTAANLDAHLQRSEDLLLERETREGIAFQATGGDPQLHFFAANRISGDVVTIKCVLESPAQSGFALYYQKPGEKEYSGRSLYTAPLQKGENTLLFRIYTPIRLDTIRVDPGVIPGRYVLKQFTLVEPSPRQQPLTPGLSPGQENTVH